MDSYYVGEISIFAGTFAPKGWAFCQGQRLETKRYALLFEVIGHIYTPEDERNDFQHFRLPDLRGRAPVQSGQGPGLDEFPLGSKGGTQDISLSEDQMPSHNHEIFGTLNYHIGPGNETLPINSSLAIAPKQIYFADGPTQDANFARNAILATAADTGSAEPFTNRGPYLGVNYIIALQGTFPESSNA